MNKTRKNLFALVLAAALALSWATPLLADDDDTEFVLRVRPGTIALVAARYGLEVEDRVAGQEIYLVEREDDCNNPGLAADDDEDDADDDVDDDDVDDDGDDGNGDDGDDGNGDDGDDGNGDDGDGDDDNGSGSGSGSGSGAGGSGGGSTGCPSGITNLSLKDFLALVRADANVLTFDVNDDIDLVEDDDNAIPAEVSDAPFQPLLPDRTLNNYFGDTAWTGYVAQPANRILRLSDAHLNEATGAGIVAVIDTGVDPDHPALRNALVEGYDFFLRQPGSATEMNDIDSGTSSVLQQSTVAFLDGVPITLEKRFTVIVRQSTVAFLDGSKIPSSFGHGTMVAGVIRLAAPTAKIMPLRAFRSDGSSDLFHLISAVYYAANHGAKVINMSFSIPAQSTELVRAIDYATARNVICVASAGNQGQEALVFPAGLRNVIGVASVSNADVRSDFSNYGVPLVSLAAPGEGVLTTYPGGTYAAAWGTSFSAPFVSATVALLAQDHMALSYSQAEQALGNAVPLAAELGAGRLDVMEALGTEIRLDGGTASGARTNGAAAPGVSPASASSAIYRCSSSRLGACISRR